MGERCVLACLCVAGRILGRRPEARGWAKGAFSQGPQAWGEKGVSKLRMKVPWVCTNAYVRANETAA